MFGDDDEYWEKWFKNYFLFVMNMYYFSLEKFVVKITVFFLLSIKISIKLKIIGFSFQKK